MSTQDFQSLFVKVQNSMDQADEALARGAALAQEVQQRVQQLEVACAAEQNKLDQEIEGIVDVMDEETVRFVGQLETLEAEA